MKVNPCNYCINWDSKMKADHKCTADVPWYCVSIYCKYFCDGLPVSTKVKKLNLKKILVSTF